MPKLRFDYSASTFDAQAHVDTLNAEIAAFCKDTPVARDALQSKLTSMLLRRSATAASRGVELNEGGPFGAIIVDFNTPDKVPKVVGYGTNHVVPTNDPSAHAEVTAIRDATKRLGKSDLSGLTLISSCECCPMCLSAATGCKIENIYFAANRKDAAKIGFSDEDQYRLMQAGNIEKHATHSDAHKDTLAAHDAAVTFTYNGNRYTSFGDEKSVENHDPTQLPCVQAIKNACSKLSELKSAESGAPEAVFHLPEDTQLISRKKPHPFSLVTADWARIGRKRSPQDPSNPALDDQNKMTDRIHYLSDEPETMHIKNNAPQSATKSAEKNNVEHARIWQELNAPSATQITQGLGKTKLLAFEKWQAMINSGTAERY